MNLYWHKRYSCSVCGLLSVLLATLSSLLTGCGGPAVKYVEARGRVLVDGQPAVGALVTLIPAVGYGERPTAMVGENGDFVIATYDPVRRESIPGAVEGQYGVVVTWYPQPTGENLESGVSIGDRLKGLYRDPSKSKLTASIAADKPDLGLFDLKSK